MEKNINIIYLASGIANLDFENVTYNDLDYDRDITLDMAYLDLDNFDFIVATPPCLYWSRINHFYNTSIESLKTKYLLPLIIWKCIALNKPFIIENVINEKRMLFLNEIKKYCFYQKVGRHCYFTSHDIDLSVVPQFDDHIATTDKNDLERQGGRNVKNVIEFYIRSVLSLPGSKA